MAICPVRTPQAELELGLGRADITPPADAYHRNWGAALHDAAAGVHLPLSATAVSMRALGGGQEHVLVAADLGWLRSAEVDALLSGLRRAAGLDSAPLVVTFSHTHSAINLDLTRTAEPGGQHIRPYLERLPERMAAAVAQARAARCPVVLVFGRGRCALAMNRDLPDPEGGWVCGANPAAPADDAVWVARATDAAGQGRGILVNYACHPTTLAWENRQISPDYPGAMRALVEQHTGVPCAFLLGPCGDLGPRDGFVGDASVAERNGRQLGHAVLEVVEALPPPGTHMEYTGRVVSGATLGIWRHTPMSAAQRQRCRIFRSTELAVEVPAKRLPSRDELEKRLAEWTRRDREAQAAGDALAWRDARAHLERARRALRRLEELPDAGPGAVTYRIALWQLGEAVLVAVGGEPYNLLQREVRRRHPATPVLFAVLANQPYSYILPAECHGTGRYQDDCSTLGPGSLERIIEAVDEQLGRWDCP